MKFFFIFAVVFFNVKLNAALVSEVYVKTKSNTEYLLISYPAQKKWVIELIDESDKNWPELVRRETFASEDEAKEFMARYKVGSSLETRNLTTTHAEVTGNVLWEVRNKWDLNWEKKYSEWIRNNLTTDFFVKYGIAVDCADVAYVMRWIFSRNNALPATNRLSNGTWFSQESVKPSWVNLTTSTLWNKDKKFMAALNYLLDLTYTRTLIRDGYPVEISLNGLSEGTMYLSQYIDSGHTQIISQTKGEIPITLLSSTIPKAIRYLESSTFTSFRKFYINEEALIKFRWPSSTTSLVIQSKMPYYSLEQFELADGDVAVEILNKLFPDFDQYKFIEAGLENLRHMLQSRKKIVENGFEFCQTHSCVKGNEGYEHWSTPSRDYRICTNLSNYYSISIHFFYSDWIFSDLSDEYLNINGKMLPLHTALINLCVIDKASSDPNASIESRWGLAEAN